VQNPLAGLILEGAVADGSTARVRVRDGEIVVEGEAQPSDAAAA
jgi:hypothetical protein